MALAPKKGKAGSEPKGDEPVEPDAGESDGGDYKQVFVDAMKDGDFAAAFDAVKACCGDE